MKKNAGPPKKIFTVLAKRIALYAIAPCVLLAAFGTGAVFLGKKEFLRYWSDSTHKKMELVLAAERALLAERTSWIARSPATLTPAWLRPGEFAVLSDAAGASQYLFASGESASTHRLAATPEGLTSDSHQAAWIHETSGVQSLTDSRIQKIQLGRVLHPALLKQWESQVGETLLVVKNGSVISASERDPSLVPRLLDRDIEELESGETRFRRSEVFVPETGTAAPGQATTSSPGRITSTYALSIPVFAAKGKPSRATLVSLHPSSHWDRGCGLALLAFMGALGALGAGLWWGTAGWRETLLRALQRTQTLLDQSTEDIARRHPPELLPAQPPENHNPLAELRRLESAAIRLTDEIQAMQQITDILDAERSCAISSSRMAELGQMASGIAHEINNPLAILRGNLDLSVMRIEEARASDTWRPDAVNALLHSIQTCQKAISRVHAIVKSLQSFARSDDSDLPTLASVQEIVLNSITLCAARLKNAGIHLEIDDIPRELEIECRPGQISRAILALVTNSIDAVEQDGEKWVRIVVQDLGHTVSISVVDSGYGIPDAIRGKIMMPFFTTKGIGKGTGLGLSVARGLVEGHQGSLRLDGNSKNTCFVIELPKVADHALARTRPSTAA